MNLVNWHSGTAAFMAVAVATSTITPLMLSAPAAAQLFPRQPYPSRTYPSTNYPTATQVTIPAGTTIPARYDEAERIVVSPEETMSLTLTVATNIITRSNAVLIPAGSQIVGQIQPVTGGSQFVARELVLPNNQRHSFNAASRVFNQTQEITRGSNTGSILRGAAIGAAAAAAVAAITGDRAIATEEVLGGAGLGALGGVLLGRRRAEVIVINPTTDLNLRLNSNLPLSTY